MPSSLSKKLKIFDIEQKWQKKWEELGIYHFDWDNTTRPVFVINTPPPYPSGELHMGNVLNWTYIDIVARYKRMNGYNVLFPQGWDCHGLSIEIEVERTYNVRKNEVPSTKFRKWCEETIKKYIKLMKESIIRLGCSIDWTTEYRTMDPSYWKLTQLSFILAYKKRFVYQDTHPVNWCPRCETAIADAEVDHRNQSGILYFIKFFFENSTDFLNIATTRPELLPACVAVFVNPSDQRYQQYVGQKIHIPIINRVVNILSDEMVDLNFGTGVVMTCTYGDKTDVKTVLKHDLGVIPILSENGKLNEEAGQYLGLSTKEAKKTIVQDLYDLGLITKTEHVSQEISICARCSTPIEILERKQWFFKTRALSDRISEATCKVQWFPDYMKFRLIDWARSLDWDWVISRQRIFGTPIPVWYCKNCGDLIVAKEEWLPIDPKVDPPPLDNCPKCGAKTFLPENDIFDTWMDSSITCAVHAGWPEGESWKTLFPADLHPSGMDIIRTWAYYLMVRHLVLLDEIPYTACLINGMVLGSDGRKMSKSLKNYVSTPTVLNKYGSDAARQWAASGGTTGSDIPFRWPDVEYGWRFLRKLWNASRFITAQPTPQIFQGLIPNLQLLDRWILSKTAILIKKTTEAYENYQFNVAVEEIRNFVWHVFCDCYIEAVKDRLYKPELYGEKSKHSANYTLHAVLFKLLQILAPITPFITEEIYQTIFSEESYKSLHLSRWPTSEEYLNKESEKNGDIIISLITAIRRDKAEKRMPLNTEIKKLTIYSDEPEIVKIILENEKDIVGTCKVHNLEIANETDKGKKIQFYNLRFFINY